MGRKEHKKEEESRATVTGRVGITLPSPGPSFPINKKSGS